MGRFFGRPPKEEKALRQLERMRRNVQARGRSEHTCRRTNSKETLNPESTGVELQLCILLTEFCFENLFVMELK